MFQGLNFRGERSVTWDASFQRAISIPQETYSLQRDNRNVEVIVVMLDYLTICMWYSCIFSTMLTLPPFTLIVYMH